VISKNPVRFENLFYTKELFRGIKDSWTARTYSPIWMLRRLVFIGVMLLLVDLNVIYKFVILIMTQLVYIMYLCKEFPFESCIESLAEISNEVFILAGMVPLVYYNKEEKWGQAPNTIYLTSLLLSNSIFTFFSIGKLFL